MDITGASRSLRIHLAENPRLVAVGVGADEGREVIVVYLKTIPRGDLGIPDEWQGFPVVIRRMGAIKPVGSST